MATVDDRLLEAGRSVLRRFGYRGMTAERVAREAGLSRVTLHRRGVTKDLILEVLTERATAAYRDALWPALTAAGPGAERLARALEAVCACAEDNLELLVALRAQTDTIFHEDAAGDVLTRSVFSEPLERLVRDGIADGTLRDADPAELATVLFNLVGWTYIHLRTGHRWPPQRASAAVLSVALHGVRADAP
jgi:AcrR family transcriptional regulator